MSDLELPYIVSGFFALMVSLAVSRFMIFLNIADIPNERSSHSQPVPRAGGVALIAGTITGLSILHIYGISVDCRTLIPGLGILLFGILGFLDDLWSLASPARFGIQILIAVIIIMGSDLFFPKAIIPAMNWPIFKFLWVVFGILWIVGFTNAFNFMDGLNGIAGGTAFVSLVITAFLGYDTGNLVLAWVAGIIAAAIPGFLFFNFPMGRLFLGDSGSYFLGAAMAVLALIGIFHSSQNLSPILFPILYFMFIFDTGITLLRRFFYGQDVFKAHRSHIYQLLTQTGWSQFSVTLLYWAFAIVQGILAVMLRDKTIALHFFVLLILFIFASIFAFRVMSKARRHGVRF